MEPKLCKHCGKEFTIEYRKLFCYVECQTSFYNKER